MFITPISKILSSQCRTVLYDKRLFHYVKGSIVIASAVRTPWGQQLGQLSAATSAHLGSVVTEAAVKQSGAPLEKIQHVYMAVQSEEPVEDEFIPRFGELFKGAESILTDSGDNAALRSLLNGIEALKNLEAEIVIVGGVQSASESLRRRGEVQLYTKPDIPSDIENYYQNSQCKLKHLRATTEGVFDSEIIPLKVIQQSDKRRILCDVIQDELAEESTEATDSAAALLLTTKKTADNYGIKPLATIKDIQIQKKGDQNTSVEEVLQNLISKTGAHLKDITHWEIDCTKDESLSMLQRQYQITERIINPHGSCSTFGQSQNTSLGRMLGHLAHSLKSKQLGFVITSNSEHFAAILLENTHTPHPPESLPNLTLFTKDHCHLCDLMVEELDSNFRGEYKLEKIYIDRKENVRYLRLYRHDIPVLYLNGQFLCMHSLNIRLLRRKLDLMK